MLSKISQKLKDHTKGGGGGCPGEEDGELFSKG